MLTETGSAPKPPRPKNWPGVDEGLRRAAEALARRDFSKAQLAVEAVLEFSPDEPRAWALLAELAHKLGDEKRAQAAKARAQALAERALSEMPASVRLAKLYWQQGEKKIARAMVALLLLKRPDDDEVRRLLRAWGEACASSG